MASLRSLVLLGLLVGCFYATAIAGRVAPAETTSMKVAQFNFPGVGAGQAGGHFHLDQSELVIGFLFDLTSIAPTETVFVTIANAVGQPEVFKLLGGVVSKVLYLKICLYAETDPAVITIQALSMEQEVKLPLAVLKPALTGVPLKDITAPVQVALTLVPTLVKKVLTVLTVLNGAGAPIAALHP